MSYSPISPIQRARAWVDDVTRLQDRDGHAPADDTTLAAVRDLAAQVEALAETVDARFAQLSRQQRQRDRRLGTRIDDALRDQTDELLVTIDAWLPAEDTPAEDAPAENTPAEAPARPRARRWLLRMLLAAIAAASIAWSATPFDNGRTICDPAIAVIGAGTACSDDGVARVATSAAGLTVAAGGAAISVLRRRAT